MSTFDMIGPIARHNLDKAEDGSVVINTITVDTGEETQVVERVIGVVDGNEITQPDGTLTRLKERSDDPHINAERRVKPSGPVNKREAKDLLQRRYDRMPESLAEDKYHVRDVDSF